MWNIILDTSKDLSELLDNNIVFIGGIGVFMHLKNFNNSYDSLLELESSHDGDFSISLHDYNDLRDLYEVTNNKRLKKSQIIIKNNEFDIYVERNNSLRIDFEDLLRTSEVIDHIRVCSLENLLILKIEAYKDRKNSNKGDKDERDLIKILYLLNHKQSDIEYLKLNLNEDDLSAIEYVVKSSKQFQYLTGHNSFSSKMIKTDCQNFYDKLNEKNTLKLRKK